MITIKLTNSSLLLLRTYDGPVKSRHLCEKGIHNESHYLLSLDFHFRGMTVIDFFWAIFLQDFQLIAFSKIIDILTIGERIKQPKSLYCIIKRYKYEKPL